MGEQIVRAPEKSEETFIAQKIAHNNFSIENHTQTF